tara:strand:+ start:3498 stop:4565 length:1068 start_codon:yes stop_codon:yes gene_type:complete
MVKLVRRFDGNPYRLVSRTYNYTRDGRPRHPIESKSIAERQAELLRQRGYNARVVSWRGGSGVYASPKKYNVTFTDTVNIKISESGLMSARRVQDSMDKKTPDQRESANLNLRNGDYQFGDSTDDQAYFFLGDSIPGVAQNTQSRFQNSLNRINEIGEKDLPTLPASSFETKRTSLAEEIHPENAVAMNVRHLNNINIAGESDSGIAGFGGELITSGGNIPKVSKPARFWVVINWNRPAFERFVGEGMENLPTKQNQPTYAFGTLDEAKEFRQKLADRIEEIGYYYDNKGGAIHSDEIDLEIKKVNRAPNMKASRTDESIKRNRDRRPMRGGKRGRVIDQWTDEDEKILRDREGF